MMAVVAFEEEEERPELVRPLCLTVWSSLPCSDTVRRPSPDAGTVLSLRLPKL